MLVGAQCFFLLQDVLPPLSLFVGCEYSLYIGTIYRQVFLDYIQVLYIGRFHYIQVGFVGCEYSLYIGICRVSVFPMSHMCHTLTLTYVLHSHTYYSLSYVTCVTQEPYSHMCNICDRVILSHLTYEIYYSHMCHICDRVILSHLPQFFLCHTCAILSHCHICVTYIHIDTYIYIYIYLYIYIYTCTILSHLPPDVLPQFSLPRLSRKSRTHCILTPYINPLTPHTYTLHTRTHCMLTLHNVNVEKWGAGVEYHFQEI